MLKLQLVIGKGIGAVSCQQLFKEIGSYFGVSYGQIDLVLNLLQID